MNTGTSHSNT